MGSRLLTRVNAKAKPFQGYTIPNVLAHHQFFIHLMNTKQIIDEQMKELEKKKMIKSLQGQHIYYKKCPKCGLIKEFSDFGTNRHELIGLHCTCLECCRHGYKKYYSNNDNKKKVLEKQSLYNSLPERRNTKNKRLRELRKLHPVKYKARYTLNHSVASGKIVKKPCEVCGANMAEAHHDDYSKPLEVRWLCPRHHDAFHAEQRLKVKEIITNLK